MEHHYSWISSTPRLWLLAIIFFAGTEMLHVESVPTRCPTLCTGEDCPPAPNCEFGQYRDNCGRTFCAKGPGEICGMGMFRMHGPCGDGMYCQCGRCFGCSLLTMQCYDKTCM